MVLDGKRIRLSRISDKKNGRFVIVPMDHGVSSGPIKGLVEVKNTVNSVIAGGATGVVLHKGLISAFLMESVNSTANIGFILHLSASTNLDIDPNAKVLIASVEEALRLGADAVSIHVNVGAETGEEMLSDLGEVSGICRKWNMPLLAMMYPRGPKIEDPFNVEIVKHVARLGAELGADIIKTNYTGSIDTFREVTKCSTVPVIIAGGPKATTEIEILNMVHDSIEAGGAGVSIGRNIFQHENIKGMTKAIAKLIIDDADVSEAITEINV